MVTKSRFSATRMSTALARQELELTPELLAQCGIPHGLDPNPWLECPTSEQLLEVCGSIDEVVEVLRPRHEMIRKQLEDPLFNGYEPVSWARARRQLEELRVAHPHGVVWLTVMGGWRSSKSEFAAKMCMEVLTKRPGRRMWAMQQTEQAARERQHSYLYRYIPKAWRPAKGQGTRRKGNTHISFSDGTGFSGEYFVLPNGGDCRFKYYASAIESLQGAELDVAWLDELAPLDHVENVEGRLATRNGFGLLTFTPLEGYSPTVASMLDRARTVVETDADLLPIYGADNELLGFEKVPLVMVCANPLRRVVYFHTSENFYGGAATLRETLKHKSRGEKLIKFYGVAEKTTGAKFTNFSDSVNILPHEGIERVKAAAQSYTWYQVYDPAGARNPFMLWAAVSAMGQVIVMREWPQPDDYIPGVGREKGVWAVSGDADDGARGPAQANFGLGNDDYSREMQRIEEELAEKCPELLHDGKRPRILVRERMMDSRAAAAPNQTSGRSVTLVEIFEELKPDPDGTDRRIYFEKASGRQSNADGDNWESVIQSALVPDKQTGAPRLIIAECCQNLIFSLKNWTGLDGQKGACRDPIDALKYLLLHDLDYVPPTPKPRRSSSDWAGYGRR